MTWPGHNIRRERRKTNAPNLTTYTLVHNHNPVTPNVLSCTPFPPLYTYKNRNQATYQLTNLQLSNSNPHPWLIPSR